MALPAVLFQNLKQYHWYVCHLGLKYRHFLVFWTYQLWLPDRWFFTHQAQVAFNKISFQIDIIIVDKLLCLWDRGQGIFQLAATTFIGMPEQNTKNGKSSESGVKLTWAFVRVDCGDLVSFIFYVFSCVLFCLDLSWLFKLSSSVIILLHRSLLIASRNNRIGVYTYSYPGNSR